MRGAVEKLSDGCVSPAPILSSCDQGVLHPFAQVQRTWDPLLQCPVVRLQPGEFHVSDQAEALCTVLGSCVAVCVHDRVRKIGGMNHFMLPEPLGGRGTWEEGSPTSRAARYGSDAMEQLLNALRALGSRPQDWDLKAFGGGRMLAGHSDIGARNIAFLHRYLATEGLALSAEDLGGPHARQVQFFPVTGQLRARRLAAALPVQAQEQTYRQQLSQTAVAGAVELF